MSCHSRQHNSHPLWWVVLVVPPFCGAVQLAVVHEPTKIDADLLAMHLQLLRYRYSSDVVHCSGTGEHFQRPIADRPSRSPTAITTSVAQDVTNSSVRVAPR